MARRMAALLDKVVYQCFAVWAFVVLLAGWMTLGSLVWVLWTRVLSYM